MSNSKSPKGLDSVFEQTITIETTQDIVVARQKGRELAQQYAFSKSEQTRFATAISELTRWLLRWFRSRIRFTWRQKASSYLHGELLSRVDRY